MREVSVQESTDNPFTASFVEHCQVLTNERILGHVFNTVTTFSAVCQTDYGIRALWHLLPLLMESVTELRLELGPHVSFSILLPFLCMLSNQFEGQTREGQTRFARVRSLYIDTGIHRFEAGQRLSLSSAIMNVCSTARSIQFLAIPVDVLAVSWDSCFEVLLSLTGLEELSFYPGKLFASSSVVSHVRNSGEGLKQLKQLYICAPLELCANVVQALGCSLSVLRIECEGLATANSMANAFQKIQSSCQQMQARPHQSLSSLSPLLLASPAAMDSMFFIRGLPTVQLVSSLTHLDIKLTSGDSSQVKLEALYPLCLMKTFTISCPLPLMYDRHQLTDLLSCWPQIECLSLNPRPSQGLGIGVLPSAKVLRDVARCGSCLREFRACLDAFDLSMADELGASDTRTWDSLRLLDLGYSIGPKDRNGVQRALSCILQLFPSLDAIGDMPHESAADEWAMELARAFRRGAVSI